MTDLNKCMLIPIETAVEVQLRDKLRLGPFVWISICRARWGRCWRVLLTCVRIHVQFRNKLHAITCVQAESLSCVVNGRQPLCIHDASADALTFPLLSSLRYLLSCLSLILNHLLSSFTASLLSNIFDWGLFVHKDTCCTRCVVYCSFLILRLPPKHCLWRR